MWLLLFRRLGTGALYRNLEAGPEAEIMKECSYWLTQTPFLYTVQVHLPKDGTPPVGNQATDMPTR